MSDEVRSTQPQQQVDVGLVARLGAKARSLRDQAKALATERDALKQQLQALTAERDEYRQRADTSATAKELDTLKQEVRASRHRARFAEIAAAKGLRREALADAWELAKYTPEADEIDDAKLTELVETQKAARPYLFGESAPAESPANPPQPPVVKPGPGSGQGAATAGGNGFNKDQALNDPKYIMQNYDRFVETARSGGLFN